MHDQLERKNKVLAGSLEVVNEENFYTDDFKKFYSDVEMTQELLSDDLEGWAVSLNSPWSQEDEKWIIECNCVDAYIPMIKTEPTFRCIYEVVGYDGISSCVIGYGNTQQNSLQECVAHFEYLQNKYNKENKRF